MPRRTNRRQIDARMTRRERRDADQRRSTSPPSWYRRHADATPCDHDVDPETVATATRYSDFGYALHQCPDCGHKWASYVEG